MPTLLVIDDEDSVRYSFRYVFEEEDVKVLGAATGAQGLAFFEEHNPDVVLLDLQLPDMSGLEVFQKIKAHDAKRPVVFITAHGTAETAIEAMKQGAFDYLVKPLELERLTQLLKRAFEASRLMRVPALLPVEDQGDRIVGRSLVIQEMCKDIGRIAPQDVNVLISGESGTGKELVARAIYHHSPRADKPFLAINCAAIPEGLLESELFGHEQGAFTGASRRRIGKFEQCDGGTIFLDEIGDMAPFLQAKILRLLQEQRFERVGGNETVQTHVRVLAATNHDLDKAVGDGGFRKDLYYRLRGVSVRVPPLRERLDDVAELAHYFLFRFNQELGGAVRAFPPETLEILQSYSWPGNVRQLQSVVRESILRARGHILFPEFLPEELHRPQNVTAVPGLTEQEPSLDSFIANLLRQGGQDLHARATDALDRVLYARVLGHTRGNQTQASEMLGISRNTLRQKLRALGFAFDRILTGSGESDKPD